MAMVLSFFAVSDDIFTLGGDGPEVAAWEYSEELLRPTHTCCGHLCDKLKPGVEAFGNEFSIGAGSFDSLNDLTRGLLVELLGPYKGGQLRRLWMRHHLLSRLRAFLPFVRGQEDKGYLAVFLTEVLNTAELALERHGGEAVIWAHQ